MPFAYVFFHLKFRKLLHRQAAVALFAFQFIAAYSHDYVRLHQEAHTAVPAFTAAGSTAAGPRLA